jgi:uroporphyrinogen-III synthase
VAVTRPLARAGGLAAALEALGAEVLVAPAIATEPPTSYAALDAALAERYDWLALTSVAAVDAVATRLGTLGATVPGSARVAAVGTATARAARERLGRVDLVPPLHAADGLADAMTGVTPGVRGARVLFPCADRARDALPAVLRARGAQVRQVVAYRTADAPPEALADLARHAAAGTLDAVLVASPSAAGAVARACRACGGEALARVAAVCIGPTTADACRALALPVAAVAAEPTDAALVDALCAALAR